MDDMNNLHVSNVSIGQYSLNEKSNVGVLETYSNITLRFKYDRHKWIVNELSGIYRSKEGEGNFSFNKESLDRIIRVANNAAVPEEDIGPLWYSAVTEMENQLKEDKS